MSAKQRFLGLRILDWFNMNECFVELDGDRPVEVWSDEVLDYQKNFDLFLYDERSRFFILVPAVLMHDHVWDPGEHLPTELMCTEFRNYDEAGLYRYPGPKKIEWYAPEMLDRVLIQQWVSDYPDYINLLVYPEELLSSDTDDSDTDS